MVEIAFHFKGVDIEGFDETLFSVWLGKVLKLYKQDQADLSYVFVSDEELLQINREYLNHDYYTDIITFDLNEGDSLIGEMYISLDRVKENAEEFAGGNFEEELRRVMAHGVLHLLGFGDKTESEEVTMRNEEKKCLELFSVSRET